jgi:hypothetical protein
MLLLFMIDANCFALPFALVLCISVVNLSLPPSIRNIRIADMTQGDHLNAKKAQRLIRVRSSASNVMSSLLSAGLKVSSRSPSLLPLHQPLSVYLPSSPFSSVIHASDYSDLVIPTIHLSSIIAHLGPQGCEACLAFTVFISLSKASTRLS